MAVYEQQRYLFMATDPVHIGTGGYRLGRVDNSIVREPGTRVPKIPGTSLHGAARAYAAKLYEKPEAAGKEHKKVTTPDKDPICYTFGYIKPSDDSRNDEPQARSGVVNIFDALILAFPVYSMAGPVWVTTYERLKEAGFRIKNSSENEHKDWGPPESWKTGEVFLTWQRTSSLNLGWLMMEIAGQLSVQAPANWAGEGRWTAVAPHLALVQEALFSHIVNSNLEVRTSVAIDPERGAAEEGALFTYEALPRATFLTAEVVLDDYIDNWPLKQEMQTRTSNGNPLPGNPWSGPLAVVEAGLHLIEWLGVGGMGTRGFGRMAIVGRPVTKTYGEGDNGEQQKSHS